MVWYGTGFTWLKLVSGRFRWVQYWAFESNRMLNSSMEVYETVSHFVEARRLLVFCSENGLRIRPLPRRKELSGRQYIDFQYVLIIKPKHNDRHCRKSLKSRFISVSNKGHKRVLWLLSGRDLTWPRYLPHGSSGNCSISHFTKGWRTWKPIFKQTCMNLWSLGHLNRTGSDMTDVSSQAG